MASKPLEFFTSPWTNVVMAGLLLAGFFNAAQNVVQTFPVAEMTALNYLRPQPMDYLWQLNTGKAPLDRNKIRIYADYYEHLLKAFPSLRDAYGLLGYLYYYLNDETKAKGFLQAGTHDVPDYFWNYYDLAIIEIKEGQYKKALDILQHGLQVPPMTSLKRLYSSSIVYLPLLKLDKHEDFIAMAKRLERCYQSAFILARAMAQDTDKDLHDKLGRANLELYAF